ncbi:hypothetical protein [Spirosoma areae]
MDKLKPGDLLIGVIGFLGILIPGAVFYWMNLSLFQKFSNVYGSPVAYDNLVAHFIISYILGHFLLGCSVPLNRFALTKKFLSMEMKAYFNTICNDITLPPKICRSYTNVFYSVYSYIRIHCPNILAELDLQAAEYKLFRNLTLVFLLDALPLSIVRFFLVDEFSWSRVIFSLCVAGLSAWRFQWLYDWTFHLAYDFYFQLQKPVSKNSTRPDDEPKPFPTN